MKKPLSVLFAVMFCIASAAAFPVLNLPTNVVGILAGYFIAPESSEIKTRDGKPRIETAFTPGNIVVYRVGDGSASLGTAATAVFLDEYTPAGTLAQSISMPTVASGSNKRLTASGTATTEGNLTRSVDGRYLIVPGYEASPSTTGVASSASTLVNRVIGRVDSNGVVDTSTALTDAISGGAVRGATSTNGADLWLSGTSSGGGIRFAAFGATTSTSLTTTLTNFRSSQVFNGQLYVSAQSGAFRLTTVGSGTPTTTGQTTTNLPGFPTGSGDPYQFFFADLTASVAGVDTVYIADNSSLVNGGGAQKYSLVAGNWTLNGTLGLATTRGLTGFVSGGNVTLFATAGSSSTTLQTASDTSGYNAVPAGAFTLIATAGTNTAFRGVALAPVAPVNVADFCNLQFPLAINTTSGATTEQIFGQIFESGITEPAGAGAGITAQVGYGPQGTDPNGNLNWVWTAATFNQQAGNNDEYVGTLTAPAVGTYTYTYRYSFDGGTNWTYGDIDGNGSNVGLTFSTAQLGTMTVTSADATPPSISYTSFGDTAMTTNRTLSVTVTDAGSGVPTSGTGLPVIYFKKLSGDPYTANQCTFVSGSSYNCTIDYSLVGGVTRATVRYYVAAQDNAGNVTVNPATGASGLTANPPAVTVPPTPNTYDIYEGFSGTINVGAGQRFTNLTNNDGLFNFLNSDGWLVGDLTVVITSDLTTETGLNRLRNLPEEGAGIGTYRILFRPSAAPRVIQGTSTSDFIEFGGIDRISVDGWTGSTLEGKVPEGVTPTRDMTIQNNGGGPAASVLIAINSGTSATDPVTNITFQNLNIVGNSTDTRYGIGLGGAFPAAGNDNNKVINCAVRGVEIGIQSWGAAAQPNLNTKIQNNDLSSAGADRVRRWGITTLNEDGLEISGNVILTDNLGAIGGAMGIGLGVDSDADYADNSVASGGISNALVSRNRIIGAVGANAYGAHGIAVAGGDLGPNTIVNNMITGVRSAAQTPDVTAGIYVSGFSTANTQVYHNSIAMTGERGAVAQRQSYGLYMAANSGAVPTVDLKNNIFYNTQTATGGSSPLSYAVGTSATTYAGLDSDYNAFFSSGAQDGGFQAGLTNHATLAGWQTAVGDDANSQDIDPIFVNPLDDLHLLGTSPVLDDGSDAGIVIDFDGDSRPIGAGFDIGADERLAASPEMDVQGNSVGIVNGDVIPDLADHTDFGNAAASGGTVVRTFTIQNTGTADLNLTGTPKVAVSGTNGADFAVTSQPSSPVAAAGSTTFQVTFDPSARGVRSATISIANDDADEDPYTFSIQGNGVNPSYRTAVSGFWNVASTWEISNDGGGTWIASSTTPTSANSDSITVRNGHTVTVQFSGVTIDQTTVDSGGAITVLDAATLTVNDGLGTDLINNGTITVNSGIPNGFISNSGTVTNNSTVNINGILQLNSTTAVFDGSGTYSYSAAGRLIFANPTGSYIIGPSSSVWPSTGGPSNVAVNGAGGVTLNVPRTINGFIVLSALLQNAGNVTVNGQFIISSGGSADAAPTYGSNALLRYDFGAFGRGPEWTPGANSQPGYPANVDIVNGATLDLANGSPSSTFQMSQSLTVTSESTLQMSGATPMTAPLRVLGSVFNNGTIELSTLAGGDLFVGGNWQNSDTLAHNSRAVTFNGTGAQSISGSTDFGQLVIQTTTSRTITFEAGSAQGVFSSLTFTGTAGNLLSLRSSSPGTKWRLTAPLAQTVSYVDVQDSNAGFGPTVNATNSVDSLNNDNWNFGATDISISDVTVTEGNSGTQTFQFTVSLSASSAQTVQVTAQTADDSASAGSDYVAAGPTVIQFDPGETSKTFDVTVNGDTTFEPDETFFVNLSSAVNGNISDSQGVGTILNDECTPIPSGVVAWYQAEGNGNDLTGGPAGIPANGATFGAGKVGQAFSLDGLDDVVSVPNASNNQFVSTTPFTIDAWVNLGIAGAIGNETGIITKWGAGFGQFGYSLRVDSATGKFAFVIDHWGVSQRDIVRSTTTPSANTWYHLAGTFDGSTLRIYVNGVNEASTGRSVSTGTPSTNPFDIGNSAGNADGGTATPRLIDEVELFNRALSDAEVLAIYDASGAGKCPVPDIAVEQPVGSHLVTTVSTVNYGAQPVGFSVERTFIIRNQGSALLTVGAITVNGAESGDFLVDTTGMSPTVNPGGNTAFKLTFTPGSLGARSAVLHIANNDGDENPFDINLSGTGDVCSAPPAGMLSWYPAEGDGKNIAGPNDGIPANGATFGAGEVGQAFSLDGLDDVVSVPNASNNQFVSTTPFTIDAWVNLGIAGAVGNETGIVTKWGAGFGQFGYSLRVDSATGKFAFVIDHFGVSQRDIIRSTTTPSANTWYHLAGTFDGSTLRIYVNGVNEGSTGRSVSTGTPSTNPFDIGNSAGNADGGTATPRLIDEVEVFNRALSSGEIQSIFNGGTAGKCHTSTFQFSSATYNVGESDSIATITVSRDGANDSAASINYATVAGGSASAPSDYATVSNTLNFAIGESAKTFNVGIVGDGTYEGDETVNLALSAPTGNTSLGTPSAAILTIVEDDPPPTTVVSLNRATGSPINPGASVTWQVVFADAVSGVSTSNFQLNNTGVGGSPALESVAAQGGTSPNTTWNISAASGTGSGTLQLDMVNDTGLSHDITNLPISGQSIVIDRELPKVSSLNPANGATGVDVDSNITINFTEGVGFQSPGFNVDCGGSIAFTSTPSIPAGNQTSIVIDPTSALPAGTLCTVTAFASDITDPAQNQLDGNGDGVGGDDFVSSFTTAATLVVDNLSDDVSKFQCTAAADDCSFRGANSVAQDSDTIVFDPNLFNSFAEGTIPAIVLGGTEIAITSDVIITGPGADKLTIDGGPGSNRIFSLINATAEISGMTLTSGGGSGPDNPGFGGAIFVFGSLTLDGVHITGNTASAGGGINLTGGNSEIRNSTISGNIAPGGCAGILSSNGANLTVVNSTISNNGDPSAGFPGGGICNIGTSLTVRNSTITQNDVGLSTGGGIYSTATLSIASSIIAGNSAAGGGREIWFGSGTVTSLGFNLIGDSAGDAADTVNPINYQLTDLLDKDPLLGSLQNNGGTTPTHKPSPGFPGHDKGCSFGSTTDQRGYGRAIDWPNISNGACTGAEGTPSLPADIGAVELLIPTAANATISGRAIDVHGRGLANVVVAVHDSEGSVVKYSRTNSFGYFMLFDIPAGANYVVIASSKRYSFAQPSFVVSLDDNVDGIVFLGGPYIN